MCTKHFFLIYNYLLTQKISAAFQCRIDDSLKKCQILCSESLCDVCVNMRGQYWFPIGPLGNCDVLVCCHFKQVPGGKQRSCSEEGDQRPDCRGCRNMKHASRTHNLNKQSEALSKQVTQRGLKRKIKHINQSARQLKGKKHTQFILLFTGKHKRITSFRQLLHEQLVFGLVLHDMILLVSAAFHGVHRRGNNHFFISVNLRETQNTQRRPCSQVTV